MAALAGRQITFLWGSDSPQEEIPGVREKGINLNGEAIDITSDDDNGWRSLLSIPAENQVDVSLSGVTKSSRLRNDWFAGTRMQPATIVFPDGATLEGNFYLVSHNETAVYNDAVAFEATIQSSGVVSYTAGSPG